MGRDVRELLRSAQAAELRGDTEEAIALLVEAALSYAASSNRPRALQMIRQARRLGATRTQLGEPALRLEDQAAFTDELPTTERPASGLGEHAPEATEPEVEPDATAPRVARPVASEAEAWCSFCCRPRAEAGKLVAGPVGAFVCASCVDEARALLTPKLGEEEEQTEAAEVESPGAFHHGVVSGPVVELVGQEPALEALAEAERQGARGLLLLGPEGSGKSTHLLNLARQGKGVRVRQPRDVELAPAGARLLLDGLEGFDAQTLERCVERPFLLALRGIAPRPSLVLSGEGAPLPLYSSASLMRASQGLLPARVADRVQHAVAFRRLEQGHLAEVARSLLARRAAELDVSEELLQALAERAARSDRGGHELETLVSRLPAGSWGLESGGKRRRPSRRKPEPE